MNKLIAILLLLPIFGLSQMDDGQKHMIAGAAINVIANEATYKITGQKGTSFFVGVGVSILATLLKEEVYDKRMGKGVYNTQDIEAGFWGTAVSGTIIIGINNGRRNKKEEIKQFNK